MNDRGMWALKVGGTHLLMGEIAKAPSYGAKSVAVKLLARNPKLRRLARLDS